MSACLSNARLAALASGEGATADRAHAIACVHCAIRLDDQAAARELARAASPRPIAGARRAELAAAVLAGADLDVPVRATRWRTAAAIGAIAAAAAAIAIAMLGRGDDAPVVAVAPVPQPALVEGVPAIARMRLDGIERVTPGEGTIVVDSVHRTRLDVTSTDTRIAVDDARISVTTHDHVIEQITVFAGSVEVVSRGKTITLERGMIWSNPVPVPDPVVVVQPPVVEHRDIVKPRPVPPSVVPPAPEPPPAVAQPDTGMGAFRTGWTRLHDGDFAGAADAFDRATDAVIAEDATYWAAVATLRAGDRASAIRRLQIFLTRFPDSTRADDARAQLRRLGS